MIWAEPPAKKIRDKGYWQTVASILKDNPGDWAFFETPSVPTITQNFQSYKGFERRWITDESGRKNLYLRYVGEEQ